MGVGIKRFKWLRQPTAWESAQAWRSHRSAMVQKFLNQGTNAASAFLSAQQNLSLGLATLAAQASIQRVQSNIHSTQQKLSDAQSQIDLLA